MKENSQSTKRLTISALHGRCDRVTFTFPLSDDWTEGSAQVSHSASFGELIINGYSECTLSLNQNDGKEAKGYKLNSTSVCVFQQVALD